MELNITNLTTAQIEQIKKQIEEMGKIDFSQYVRICGDGIAIMGDKMLENWDKGEIIYGNHHRDRYIKTPKYTLTTLSELEVGDVFIRTDDVEDMILKDFSIFIGKDNDGDYIYQYLNNGCGKEIINRGSLEGNYEVYKFLRD